MKKIICLPNKILFFQHWKLKVVIALLVLCLFSLNSSGQNVTSIFAEGLNRPISVAVDKKGWVWVSEQGTGKNDGRISVITGQDEVYPVITGLPSDSIQGDISGPNKIYFNPEGDLVIVQGEGDDTLSRSILLIDTSGYTPEQDTLQLEDISEIYRLGDFLSSSPELTGLTYNPYALAYGANGDLFIADAGANAIIRRNKVSGALSVFAKLPTITNKSAAGPPQVHAVPTGILYKSGYFYVSTLTGFPFQEKAAKVFKIDTLGNVTILHDSLTTLVDIAFDPDSNLVLTHFSSFSFNPAPGFVPNTGSILYVKGSDIDTLETGLNTPTALAFNTSNQLFVSLLRNGEIISIQLHLTETEKQDLSGSKLTQNYPNPFTDETDIGFTVIGNNQVNLSIYNASGIRIRTLVNEIKQAGDYKVVWDGKSDNGVSSNKGLYFYRLEIDQKATDTKKLILGH